MIITNSIQGYQLAYLQNKIITMLAVPASRLF